MAMNWEKKKERKKGQKDDWYFVKNLVKTIKYKVPTQSIQGRRKQQSINRRKKSRGSERRRSGKQ